MAVSNGHGHPTASSGRRLDLSSPAERASGARVSEHYRRIAPLRRTEPCACGTDITAEVGWEQAAVDDHNATAIHQSWRARQS